MGGPLGNAGVVTSPPTPTPAPGTPPGPVVTAKRGMSAAGILTLLTLANILNFYDRAIPAIIVEPIKAEFGLSDGDIGLISSSFTVVYAIAGIMLGRVADQGSRRKVMAGDVFHADHRSRAISVLQLGIPGGLLLAFLTVGPVVEATGSWRIPFVIASIPGFVLAFLMLRIPEAVPGSAEDEELRDYETRSTTDALRHLLAIPTLRWLILSGVGTQIASYAVATFLVPLLQRYFHLPLGRASMSTGLVIGVTGVIGLLIGGQLADRASRRSPRARLLVGVAGLSLAAPLGATAVALNFAVGYLLGAALGPVLTGFLSDWFTRRAARLGPHGPLAADALGLHWSLLVIVPASLVWAAVAGWWASRHIHRDHQKLLAGATPVAG